MKTAKYNRSNNVAILVLGALLTTALVWSSIHTLNRLKEEEHQNAERWKKGVERHLSLISDTEVLLNTVRNEEKKKMDVWAEAMAKVGLEEESDFALIKRILQNNSSIPTVVVDGNNRVQYAINLNSRLISTPSKIDSTLTSMRAGFDPIPINLRGLEQKAYMESRI
jgi:hypothetical protein